MLDFANENNCGGYLKFSGYQCFKKGKEEGFDILKPLNFLIGPNNSGKSRLIDLIEYCFSNEENSKILRSKNFHDLEVVKKYKYYRNSSRNPYDSRDRDFTALNGCVFKVRYISSFLAKNIEIMGEPNGAVHSYNDIIKGWINSNFFGSFKINSSKFIRLSAERDVRPELSIIEDLNRKIERKPALVLTENSISENGDGMTQILELFIGYSDNKYPEELVKEILKELNFILSPVGINFCEISIQIHSDNTREIYLRRFPDRARIPLSASGSGIKTVLLVLAKLILVPFILDLKEDKNECIFAFEELENNMHPVLLRSLLNYVREFIEKKKHCMAFITTHSSVILDMFMNDELSQISEIRYNEQEERAEIKNVSKYLEASSVLDSLGVKPSDILQANCIIWVEGPSDRIYLKRWIELYSDGELKEMKHYQCLWYGGSLLKHCTAVGPDENKEDKVAFLAVNPRVIFVGDSDFTEKRNELKPALDRIMKEIDNNKGAVWITEPKEIENYLTGELLSEFYGKKIPDPSEKEPFADFMKNQNLELDKVHLAKGIIRIMDTESLRKRFDFEKRITEICLKIRQWNGL